MHQSLLTNLREDCALLADYLLPKLEDTDAIELVLRDRLTCDFGDLLQCLQRLGTLRPSNLTGIFLYKDFVSNLSQDEQVQFYEALGQALGGLLEELSLSFVKLPVASLASLLRRMPRLQKLYLGRVSLLAKTQAPQLYAVLENDIKHLKEFHCSLAPAINSTAAPMFAAETDTMDELLLSLAQIPSLQTLYLAAPGGTIQQTACLRALSVSTVTDLTLMNCPLRTPQHVQALLHQSCFTSLALMNAQIGDAGAAIFVQQCLQEDGLQKLYLPGNQLTNMAGNAIARSLPASLTVLDLHDNHLTAQFGRCMGATLQHSTTLQFLDVSYNPLHDAGGMALACALANNTSLQQLNLFQNQISDSTCVALATALRSNRNLKQLNLYHNPQIKNVDLFLHNLEHENYVLERLEVSSNKEAALDFWLTLNRKFGRQRLLNGNTTEHQYLEKGLGQAIQCNDLNSLFYFLKAKPALCNTSTGTVPTATTTSQRKQAIRRGISMVTAEACKILAEDF